MIAAATTLIVAAIIIIYIFDPSTTNIYPRCPSKLITGYDCPGCGSLRALHALCHGDIATAWHFNPALFFAIPLIIIYIIADNCRPSNPTPRTARNLQRLHHVTHHPLTPILLLIAIIIWTITRNL